MMTTFELCCFDMAGTTVRDDGAVTSAFLAALEESGVTQRDERLPRMLAYIHETMGLSKITVFRHLFGDEEVAQAANKSFENHYGALVLDGRIESIPGSVETINTLRESGVAIAFLTGFSAVTRDDILRSLGWEGLADIALCPADAGRGRPFPDLVLTAALKMQVSAISNVVVIGDTPADIATGLSAGASQVIGVLTGVGDEPQLLSAGATAVLPSVVELPAFLGL